MGIDTTQFDLSAYSGDDITWSVESFINKIRSGGKENTINLCNFENPPTPVLFKNRIVITTETDYNFNWTNPKQDERQRCGVDLSYTYNVSISKDGKEIYSNNMTETSVTLNLTTGKYTWQVIASNGILLSNTEKEEMSFCVPEEIP